MNIREASMLTGISRDMLRHYEKLGILSPGRNPGNGYRDYSMVDINNAVMIKQYSSLGISLRTLTKLSRQGDVHAAQMEMEAVIRRLEADLEWTRARLENAKDYSHLFSTVQEGIGHTDTGICPTTYYYRRPEDGKGFSYTEPCANGAVRMVFRIAPEDVLLEEFPTDQGILSLKQIENYPFPYIEIPAHRYWRTVIEQDPDAVMNGSQLQRILRKMNEEGYALAGGVLLSQIMSATPEHPKKLVCIECEVAENAGSILSENKNGGHP